MGGCGQRFEKISFPLPVPINPPDPTRAWEHQGLRKRQRPKNEPGQWWARLEGIAGERRGRVDARRTDSGTVGVGQLTEGPGGPQVKSGLGPEGREFQVSVWHDQS